MVARRKRLHFLTIICVFLPSFNSSDVRRLNYAAKRLKLPWWALISLQSLKSTLERDGFDSPQHVLQSLTSCSAPFSDSVTLPNSTLLRPLKLHLVLYVSMPFRLVECAQSSKSSNDRFLKQEITFNCLVCPHFSSPWPHFLTFHPLTLSESSSTRRIQPILLAEVTRGGKLLASSW